MSETKKKKTPVKKTPRLEKKFIKTIEGKEFVLYAGLLDLSTQIGLSKIEVELIQIPAKENNNLAICRASAITKSGEQFIDYGDANPANCNARVSKHLIRMASTRAKARCLRDLTNVGITALEELGDLSEVIDDKPHTGKSKLRKVSEFLNKDKTGSSQTTKTSKNKPAPEAAISQAQKSAIQNLGKRRGIKDGDLDTLTNNTYGKTVSELSSKEASEFIKTLQKTAA